MKALFFSLGFLGCISVYGQNYVTGDAELNNTLVSVNSQAKTNLPDFKLRIVNTYGTTLPQVETCFSSGMTPGDVFMAFEISKVSRKPLSTVIANWKANKANGWGVIAKNMGIKPGSAAFHQLKNNAKSHAGRVKPGNGNNPPKGNNGTHGNGNGSAGKGHGQGKK